MQKNLFFFSFVVVFVACMLFASSTVHSAGIKERMAARLPTINALKKSGTVGENNLGFLAFRTGDTSKKAVVDQENHDRKIVYQAIGKKQGAKAKLVGQRRAKMIAQKGGTGQWFQKSDGSWYKK